MHSARLSTLLLLASALIAAPAFARHSAPAVDLAAQQWNGNAVSYSGYRAGQNPDTHVYPTHAQILEDMKILAKNWKVIRLYGSDQHAEDVLQVIKSNKIGIKVMLGVWLTGKPEKLAENAPQIANAIRLANTYRKIVVAVSVGNEILVSWSDHKLTEDQALDYVRQVKQAVKCPVTVADDFLYWQQPQAKLVDAVDFIVMHAYPLWGGEDIDTAMPTTIRLVESVRKAHPGKTVVLGEAGWATYTDNKLNAPRAGDETKQKRYNEELTAWAKANNITVFFFEAFDESWKGNGTEGHWGLFSESRKAKLAMQALYPELMPDAPLSPGYDAVSPAAPAPAAKEKP